jgi:hypothetical protein
MDALSKGLTYRHIPIDDTHVYDLNLRIQVIFVNENPGMSRDSNDRHPPDPLAGGRYRFHNSKELRRELIRLFAAKVNVLR